MQLCRGLPTNAQRINEYHALVLPDFWLQVEWLWQEPLMHPLWALGEIAGVEPEVIERFLQALRGEDDPIADA